jgi:hypothetical protein
VDPVPGKIATRDGVTSTAADRRWLDATPASRATSRVGCLPAQKRGLRSRRPGRFITYSIAYVASKRRAAPSIVISFHTVVLITHRSPDQNQLATPRGARGDARWIPNRRRRPAADVARWQREPSLSEEAQAPNGDRHVVQEADHP